MATRTPTNWTTATTNERCVCGVPEHGHSPFDFATLHRAWLDCRRGKGNTRARWAFEFNLEQNLLRLAKQLQSRNYRPSPSVCFISEQPKRREIFAAAFRDRIIHHLLVRQIEPWWEARFIFDTYACRKGKGTLAAVERAQQFIRQVSHNGSQRAWALHLDIRSFFVRINKAILNGQVEAGLRRQRLPWKEDLIWLADTIIHYDPTIDAHQIGHGFNAVPAHKSLYHTENLTGLPIGNYSSQFFANVYLNPLDQYIKHELKIRFYLRYVDDLLLFDPDPDRLRACELAIDNFLHSKLALELNSARRALTPVSNGVDVLGYIVWPHYRRLRRRTANRFEHLLNEAARQCLAEERCRRRIHLAQGQGDRLLAQVMSYRGMYLQAAGTEPMQEIEKRHAWLGKLWRIGAGDKPLLRTKINVPPRSLAWQWRAYRRIWPQAVIVLQVGKYWEAYGRDAQWLREVLGLAGGRIRRGLGQASGFPVSQRDKLRFLLKQTDRDIVLLRQTGRQSGEVQERELALLIESTGQQTAGHWFESPKGIRQRAKRFERTQ